MNDLNVLLERFACWLRTQDWSSRPNQLESPIGTVGCSYPGLDDDGEPYVIVDLALPRGFWAEVDGGVWGGLKGLRFYPEELT